MTVKLVQQIVLSIFFCLVITALSLAVEFYALYPWVLGSDGDPKALAALAVYLIMLAPTSAIPAFIMAMYATRFMV